MGESFFIALKQLYGKGIQNYHSYPAAFILMVMMAGIGAGWAVLGIVKPVHYAWLLCILFLTAVFYFNRAESGFLIVVAMLVFTLGAGRVSSSLALFPVNHLAGINTRAIRSVSGIITDAVLKSDGRNRYLLECDSLGTVDGNKAVCGRLILYQGKLSGRLEPGDRVRISDSPEIPSVPGNPGAFNYRRYVNMNGIHMHYYIRDTLRVEVERKEKVTFSSGGIFEAVRHQVTGRIDSFFEAPDRDLLKALILGIKSDLDRDLVRAFQLTGVVHVLAISGLHVGFIIILLHVFFSLIRCGHSLRMAGVMSGLLFYVILVDFKISVVRSVLMAGLYFAAQLSQRNVKPINILAGAGLIIVGFTPQQLLSPGFQFSFAAVGSILYGYPRLNQLFPVCGKLSNIPGRIAAGTRNAFIVSLAATLGTLPLTWYYYGYIPFSGIFLNLLIIPLIGCLVCCAFIFLLFSFLPGLPAEGFSELISFLISLITTGVGSVAKIPGLVVYLPGISLPVLLLLGVSIILVFNLRSRHARYFLYVLLGLLIMRPALYSLYGEAARLKVWYLDVGQGDAAVLQCPGKRTVVIDAGERNYYVDKGEQVVVPFLRKKGINRIQYLVGTHGHSDHIGGILSILGKITVDTLVLSAYPMQSNLYKEMLDLAATHSVPVRVVSRGERLNGIPGMRLYILHPTGAYTRAQTRSGGEVNNSSVVLLIQHGETRMLFTGDVEADAEPMLSGFGKLLDADILKVGHHGSKTSSSLPFLKQVNPGFAVVSVGERNKFRHPSPGTIHRILRRGIPCLRTDRLGALCFVSDGREVYPINWRPD